MTEDGKLTLQEAKDHLDAGHKFGDIFPFLHRPTQVVRKLVVADQEIFVTNADELKRHFCFPPKDRNFSVPGTTGEFCPQCNSTNIKKTGTCSVCMDCGEPVGGCS